MNDRSRFTVAFNIKKYMKQILSITPLESIGIALVAVGIFLFFRACWRNIQRGGQDQYNS